MDKRIPEAPWATGLETNDFTAQVVSADGCHIATVEIDPLIPTVSLIAAAPELLAHLSRMVEYLAVAGCDGAYDTEIESAMKVIAKAEGRPA